MSNTRDNGENELKNNENQEKIIPSDFPLHLSKSNISQKLYSYWNEEYSKGANKYKYKNGIKLEIKSYTHFFLEQFNSYQFLNTSCADIVQFGQSFGALIEEYKNQHWNVVGYDFSETAFNNLQAKGVPVRLVDLNSIDDNHHLTYEQQLLADTSKITNLLLIRILEYLEPEATMLLLFAIMDHAKKGSVFFIATKTVDFDEKTQKQMSNEHRFFCFEQELAMKREALIHSEKGKALFRHLVPTFFMTRTDMVVERHYFAPTKRDSVQDEVLIVRKI